MKNKEVEIKMVEKISTIESAEKQINEKEIKNLLKSLGMSPKTIGYFMIVKSIKLMLTNPGYINVTKLLYPELGRTYRMKPAAIERNIRTCIQKMERAWAKTDTFNEERRKIFGCMNSHYTNKEFMYCIVDYFSLL